MSAALTPGRPVDIGGPIPGVDLLVLDARLRPVPIGVPGDLYAAGAAPARGYLERPDLTAERFVANPFGPTGSRMYRTGDVVRWARTDRGDLVVDYLGRGDDQVKLRGLRIELGEIEEALTAHPAVDAAVVIGVGGSVATSLAAYVVLGRPAEPAELRDHLARRLPAHMVPATVTGLDAIPLTSAGKVDKRALPAPTVTAAGHVEARTPAEQAVAAVFAEVLGIRSVSVTAGFFDLGGNSLSATRLAARAGEVLGADLSVRDVFDAPTVRDLVGLAALRGGTSAPVTATSPRPERIPLSFAQQRMWFLNRFDPSSAAYNIPVGLRLRGHLDVGALRTAIADVVARHEILRTTFPAVDGAGVQRIAPAEAGTSDIDWAEVASAAELTAAATAGFDVTTQTPFRVRLWHSGDDEWTLLAVIHHIVGDGESMTPLVRDMITAYVARAAGSEPEFVPLAVQFADYALWQHRELGSAEDTSSVIGRQVDYWSHQLRGTPDVLDLPADRPRPTVASHHGAQLGFSVPAELGGRIDRLATEHGVTAFMVVHAALAVLLSRLSATDDIAIATPIAGRGRRELDALIGMFVNTLVLRTRVDPGMTFADLLEEVRTTDLEAFTHADVPFETLVEVLEPTRSQAFSPLAQVMLSLTAPVVRGPVYDGTGIEMSTLEPPAVAAQVDLSFTLATAPGADWSGSVVFATDLFDEPSVATMVDRFVTLLDALVAAPGRAVNDAAMVAPAELDDIVAWSSGIPAPPSETTLVALTRPDRNVPEER
nr:condensation domain-containing protein [Gordonia sp. NB41Y]